MSARVLFYWKILFMVVLLWQPGGGQCERYKVNTLAAHHTRGGFCFRLSFRPFLFVFLSCFCQWASPIKYIIPLVDGNMRAFFDFMSHSLHLVLSWSIYF